MSYSYWNYPTSIVAGSGCLDTLADTCVQLGIYSPLLVTDAVLVETGIAQQAIDLCHQANLSLDLFSDVQGNPTGANVSAGIDAFLQGGHDGIIAFGGGSSLDCAKAVALVARQQHDVWAFEDTGDNWTKAEPSLIAPVIAVPTTAGTGSEVGRASVITDESEHKKKIIFHPLMLPKNVILDPDLTTALPAGLTAATGMDALSHNLEALCSPGYHPMAEGIAFEGIRLVQRYLPLAYQQGNNTDARMQMLVASCMGATAFQKGLGGMHALAHSLGALYNKHHGLLNAILMPYVMQANKTEISEKMTRLASFLDLPSPGFDAVLNWVLSLRAGLGIPHTLADIGIDDLDAELVGMMAVRDPTASGNPVALTAQDYQSLFCAAVNGKGC